jgi:hypothetical protein
MREVRRGPTTGLRAAFACALRDMLDEIVSHKHV